MKITITGGCGYVGSTLLPKLQEISDSLTVIDQAAPQGALLNSLDLNKVSFHQVDVADESKARPLMKDSNLIIHLAALVGYPACNKSPDLAVRTNVGGTKVVLRSKAPDARVLFASTCSNYGAQNGQVTEESEVNPTSLYGKTKVRGEQLVLRDSKNIVFRFAGGFGYSPNTREDLLIHDFVSKAVFGIPLSIYESHFVRQFIHVEDMTDAIRHAIANWEQMKGEIYNVGNPRVEITKKQLIEKIAENITFDHKFENSGMDLEKRNYPVSFEKMLGTGFTPKFSLDSGVKELIQYYQAEKIKRTKVYRRPARAAA